MAATTWRPAFSMSTSEGMPISSIVYRSASRICAAVRIRIWSVCMDRSRPVSQSALGGVYPHPTAQDASSTGGQEQNRLRSPYGLSMRPTLGQNLFAATNGKGKAAVSLGYGWVHSVADTEAAVWGA